MKAKSIDVKKDECVKLKQCVISGCWMCSQLCFAWESGESKEKIFWDRKRNGSGKINMFLCLFWITSDFGNSPGESMDNIETDRVVK